MRNAWLVSEHDMLRVMYHRPGFLDGAGSLNRPAKDSLDGTDLLNGPAEELSGQDKTDSLSVSCRHH